MQVIRIIETTLYGTDVEAMQAFYERVIALKPVRRLGEQGVALACGDGMLLLFNPSHTRTQTSTVPRHGADGEGHCAFAIHAGDYGAWRQHLERNGVAIEADVDWPGGGHSIYFRDPAGNSVELTTAATWQVGERNSK